MTHHTTHTRARAHGTESVATGVRQEKLTGRDPCAVDW